MSTQPTHQPGGAGGPATSSRQPSPTAAITLASGPPMLRAIRGQASYQPQHFYSVAGINHPWQPQSRVYRPAPQAPNVLMNHHSAWMTGPAQAAAPLGQYPGPAPVSAGLSWQGAAAPVPAMWPTAPGILNQRPGPSQQKSRCQEWTPIEEECLLTLKRQGMTHPKIAQALSETFNVDRTHHMVTKKLAALRKEAIKPNMYAQSIKNVLPRSLDVLFEELSTEMGMRFAPSEERKNDLERFLVSWFSGVILDGQRPAGGAGGAGGAGAAGANAMGSQGQAQFGRV